jgi:glycosyltransferase involved in cell wall biosynthesis
MLAQSATTGLASTNPAFAADTSRRAPMVLHARVITGAGGGPDKTILNSPRFLRERGYRCECAFLRPPGDQQFEAVRRRAQTWEAAIVEVDDPGPWSRDLVSRMTKICSDREVDVWHAHDYKTNLLGLLVRRRRPMRLITTCHGWVERTWRTRAYYLADWLTLRQYERVVAVSSDIYAACRRLGVSAERLRLIENAIDTDEYVRGQSHAEAKRALAWPSQRAMVGAVGRLSHEKGFDILLDAVALLLNKGRDVGLAVAGDGPAREALQQRAAARGLADRVRWLGFQQDLVPLYEAMDVYALSSRREGLPNVLLEAMSLETPVVATRVAGVPRLIDDGANGLLTPIGDARALADAIARLLDDGPLRQRLAAAGRQTIVERYSFSARMAKIANLYDDLLATKAPARD